MGPLSHRICFRRDDNGLPDPINVQTFTETVLIRQNTQAPLHFSAWLTFLFSLLRTPTSQMSLWIITGKLWRFHVIYASKALPVPISPAVGIQYSFDRCTSGWLHKALFYLSDLPSLTWLIFCLGADTDSDKWGHRDELQPSHCSVAKSLRSAGCPAQSPPLPIIPLPHRPVQWCWCVDCKLTSRHRSQKFKVRLWCWFGDSKWYTTCKNGTEEGKICVISQ